MFGIGMAASNRNRANSVGASAGTSTASECRSFGSPTHAIPAMLAKMLANMQVAYSDPDISIVIAPPAA